MKPRFSQTLFVALTLLASLVFQVSPIAAAPIVRETFRNSTASGWVLYDSACLTAGSTTDACAMAPNNEGNGNGWLRLTSATNDQRASAIYNTAFSSANGIQATFQYATYGGDGADGFTFYLIDGATATPTTGGLGGALGYTFDSIGNPGVTNGYLAVGFDEYGAFLNPAGSDNACSPNGPEIKVAGSGNLAVTPPDPNRHAYDCLQRVAAPIATGNRAGARWVRITIAQSAASVKVETSPDQVNWTTNIAPFSLPPTQVALPATFKMGFSGATGGSTNFHEIRDLVVTGAQTSTTSVVCAPNPSTVGQSVTCTATVGGSAGTPTGTVDFYDDTTLLQAGVALDGSGQATYTTSAFTLGSHTITANYGADLVYGASSGNTTQQVTACSTPITVTSNADSGAGTLRQALLDVCAGGTINFANPVMSGATITLTSGELGISNNVTIDGSALASQVTVSGGGTSRVFNITGGSSVTLNSLTIANGNAPSNSGGGIYMQTSGAVTVTNSLFYNNRAGSGAGIFDQAGRLTVSNTTFDQNIASLAAGGGIYVGGTGSSIATVSNSTFSGNSGDAGGGIFNGWFANLTLRNSTFSGNIATAGSGGGLFVDDQGTASLSNNIFANSTASSDCYRDTGNSVVSTNNLVETDASAPNSCAPAVTGDPLLSALGNYGGATQTFALLPGSPAINAGDSATCAGLPGGNLDQRGKARVGACDIGSFESGGFTLSLGGGNNQSTTVNTAFATRLQVNVASNAAPAEPVNGGQVTFAGPLSGAGVTPITQTATIVSSTANVTATANATVGGPYTVSANANGSTGGVNFSLTNLPACSTPITVTSNADSGAGTLRQALLDVCAGGTINFANPVMSGATITLTSGELVIGKNLTIDGSALASPISISGNNAVRVFMVNSGVTANLIGLRIINGYASGTSGAGIYNAGVLMVSNSTLSGNNTTNGGAGIWNLSSGTLLVSNSTFSGNNAASGGGIVSQGVLTVSNSTFFSNTALSGGGGGYSGGGIYNSSGTLTVLNSTFSGNGAANVGGGIYNIFGTLNYANTIIANSTGGGDCVNNAMNGGVIGVNTNNLVQDGSCSAALSGDPLLNALADNGGRTATMALRPGSPAIDAGNDATCAAAPVNDLDQRGVARPQGAHCDIGAYEVNQFTLTVNTAGNGSGVVMPAVGSHFYISSTVVPITATANPGSSFAGWSGDLTGSANPATVTMTGDKVVTATFNTNPNADLVVTQSYQLNFLHDITFTLTVRNLGPNAAANAVVSDTFPAGNTTWTWSCVSSGGATCTANGSGNIGDTLASFPSGGVVTYTVHGNLANWSRWTNTVEVIPPAGITDAVPNNNRATVGRYEVFLMLIFKNATP